MNSLFYIFKFTLLTLLIIIMVLERHPKKYKYLMKIMLQHLVEHQHIITTSAKAKHLKKHAQKLLRFAKKAQAGQTSPINLLKGRVYTQKARQKLLLNIVPRIKHIQGGYIDVSTILNRRRGDNAPMVSVSIKGNQKSQYEKLRKQEELEKGIRPDIKAFSVRTLMEEKEYFEAKIEEEPQKVQFFQKKIARIEHEIWIAGKTRREPPKYSLIV